MQLTLKKESKSRNLAIDILEKTFDQFVKALQNLEI